MRFAIMTTIIVGGLAACGPQSQRPTDHDELVVPSLVEQSRPALPARRVQPPVVSNEPTRIYSLGSPDPERCGIIDASFMPGTEQIVAAGTFGFAIRRAGVWSNGELPSYLFALVPDGQELVGLGRAGLLVRFARESSPQVETHGLLSSSDVIAVFERDGQGAMRAFGTVGAIVRQEDGSWSVAGNTAATTAQFAGESYGRVSTVVHGSFCDCSDCSMVLDRTSSDRACVRRGVASVEVLLPGEPPRTVPFPRELSDSIHARFSAGQLVLWDEVKLAILLPDGTWEYFALPLERPIRNVTIDVRNRVLVTNCDSIWEISRYSPD